MENKNNVQPQDFFHLYSDNYIDTADTDAQLTDEDIEQMQAEIDAENARNGFNEK